VSQAADRTRLIACMAFAFTCSPMHQVSFSDPLHHILAVWIVDFLFFLPPALFALWYTRDKPHD